MLPHIVHASASTAGAGGAGGAGGSRRRALQAIRCLSTTAPLAVKRPQKPYQYEPPSIDPYGRPYRAAPELGERYSDDAPYKENAKTPAKSRKNPKKSPLSQHYHDLERLAEPTATGWYERYGSHDGYGLKNKPRFRVNDEGKVEPWDAAGSSWKRKLAFSLRRKVEVPGFQHRKSPKLDPVSFRPFAKIQAPGFQSGTALGIKAIAGRTEERSQNERETEQEREAVRERNQAMRARIPTLERIQVAQTDDISLDRPQPRSTADMSSPTFGVRKFSTIRPLCRAVFDAKLIKPMITTSSIETKTGKPLGRRVAGHDTNTRVPRPDRRKRADKSVADTVGAAQAQDHLRQHLAPDAAPDHTRDQNGNKLPWRPTKKLTYSAMAGLRALHETDPQQYSRAFLADKFGISFEAVSRILRSNWRTKVKPGRGASLREARPASDHVPDSAVADKSLAGTKWDPNPDTSPTHSPIHAIFQARRGSGPSSQS